MKYLGTYNNKERYIYSLKESGNLVGFTMVNDHLRANNNGLAVAEFYFDKERQMKGYGRKLAESVFDQFPGQWEVAVARRNTNAQTFWQKLVSNYTSGNYRQWKIDSYDGIGFSFYSVGERL